VTTEIIRYKRDILYPLRNRIECCCIPCCGLPTNCTLTATVYGATYTFDHSIGSFRDDEGNPTAFPGGASFGFGNCYQEGWGTDDDYYKSCCISLSHADTPELEPPLCGAWVEAVAARIVCDECCGGDPILAKGCRLERYLHYMFDRPEGACSAFMPGLSLSMTCTEEECNPLP